MKKKLFLLLLIVALAAFVFTGCTPPAEGEGEGEGEGEVEDVIIEFAGQYLDAGRTYVKGGNRKITVTFPEAVSGVVTADVSDCSGDYSKGTVGLFSADGIVWEGSVKFSCKYVDTGPCAECEEVGNDCCSSVVTVSYEGKKEQVAVIVDCEKPVIGPVEICLDDCACEGCKLTFKSAEIKYPCDDNVFCEDKCSGFAGWTIALYNKHPFDHCCETPCYEPIDSGDGDCRVDWTSNICLISPSDECNKARTVFALITAVDNVGNTLKWLAEITIKYCGMAEEQALCEDKDDCNCWCLEVKNINPVKTSEGKYCVDTPQFSPCPKLLCPLP